MDYVFGGDCEAVLYYADVKKRIQLPLKDNFEVYNRKLIELLKEIRTNFEQGVIPPIRKGQKCSGCSMKDLCMPSIKKSRDLLSEIRRIQCMEE